MPGQVSEALEKAKAAQEALKGNKAPEFEKLSLWVFFFFLGGGSMSVFWFVWVEMISSSCDFVLLYLFGISVFFFVWVEIITQLKYQDDMTFSCLTSERIRVFCCKSQRSRWFGVGAELMSPPRHSCGSISGI